jgi:uncharacterized protein YndB with AHSA1/START domain
MSKYGERIGPRAVRFTRIFPGPIDRVWGHLVEGEKRATWFCGGDTGQSVGETIEMVFEHEKLSPSPDDPPPQKYAEYGGRTTSSGRITRYDRPHAFAFTWYGEDEESEVLFELTEVGADVRLVLTHTHLRTREDMVGVLGGWHAHLDILEDVLEGRVPDPFWRRFTPLDEEYDSSVGALGD